MQQWVLWTLLVAGAACARGHEACTGPLFDATWDAPDMPPTLCTALQRYAAFHSDNRMNTDAGVIVYTHGFGGLSDRLRGVFTLLTLAMCTGRLLFVEELVDAQDSLLAAGPINVSTPEWVPRHTPVRLGSGVADNHRALSAMLSQRVVVVTSNLDIANIHLELVTAKLDRPLFQIMRHSCLAGTCSGLAFHAMFRYNPLLQDVAALAETSARILTRIRGRFTAFMMRAGDAHISYHGKPMKLTMYPDGVQKNSTLQHIVDIARHCDAAGAAVFLASDSVLYKALLLRHSGALAFSCGTRPGHVDVQHSRPLETAIQLFYDIEMASRASRIVHVGGGFPAVALHWHRYNTRADTLYATDTTTPDELCGP